MGYTSILPAWALPSIILTFLVGMILYVTRLNLHLRYSQRVLKSEIGERRKAEEKLAENEDRLRQIIASEPECVKLQTYDGILLEMNQAGLNLVDASEPGDIIGTSVYDIIAPEFRDEYQSLTERVFSGQSGVMEFQIISLKGRKRWMETHAVPLRGRRDDVIALLGITRDVTARKHAEDEVRLHYRELAHAARINTMGEMASGLAHELNQPLAAIANYSKGCLRRIRSGVGTIDDMTKAIEEVCTQAERAGHIIRSLRKFVQKGETPRQVHDLHAIVRETMLIAGPELKQNKIHVKLNLSSAMYSVLGQAIQIEQVILNLVRNAIEAMSDSPLGQRVLELKTYIEEDTAVVEVSDSGPKISSQTLARIFEPFYTTKSDGMGMGLPICRSIVEAHGGMLVAFHKENDSGLVFRFTLRLAE